MGQDINVLREYAFDLKEIALKIRAELDSAPDAYLSGQLFGLVRSISLLQQQAAAFGLAPDALNLGDFDAERDLLSSRGREIDNTPASNKSLEAIIASPPERKELVVQLFIKDGDQWGEVYREGGHLKVELYGRPNNLPWQLDLKEVQHVIELARQELGHRL